MEQADGLRNDFAQALDQPGDNAHAVGQQGVVGGMMNLTLDGCGVDPKFVAILQSQLHRRLHDQLVDVLHRVRRDPVKGTVESVVLGDGLGIRMSELAQTVAVGDALAQLRDSPKT